MLLTEAPPGRLTVSASRSHVRPILVLVILCLALFLPGIARVPAVDADEGRFVQATKQMVETGNYTDIRLQELPRSKKPIGIYWLQSAAIFLTGQGAAAPIWAYRLPSVLGALLAVLLTYWTTLTLFGRQAALVAGALMGASVVLIVEAHLAKTDAALLATIVAAQGVLARLYMSETTGAAVRERLPLRLALVFWGALGAGILIKGPVILMIVGLTIATLIGIERGAGWLRGLRPLAGIAIVLAMVVPWLALTFLRSGPAFFQESIGTDLVGKILGGQESHAAPPGTHTLLLGAMFWPGSFLLALSIGWIWQNRADRAVRFCLAWFIPSLIAFEVATTKLPHYTMPLFPAAAALVGGALAAGGRSSARWTRWGFAATALVPILIVLAGFGLYLRGVGTPPVGASLAAAAAVILAVAALVAAVRGRAGESFRLTVVSLVPVVAAIIAGLAPHADRLWPARAMAALVSEAAGCADPAIAVAGFGEASVPFELGTETRILRGAAAADFLAAPGCRMAFVESREAGAFVARAGELGLRLESGPTVRGLDLTFFRQMTLTAFRPGGGA